MWQLRWEVCSPVTITLFTAYYRLIIKIIVQQPEFPMFPLNLH